MPKTPFGDDSVGNGRLLFFFFFFLYRMAFPCGLVYREVDQVTVVGYLEKSTLVDKTTMTIHLMNFSRSCGFLKMSYRNIWSLHNADIDTQSPVQ
jgi:hypothetical protein